MAAKRKKAAKKVAKKAPAKRKKAKKAAKKAPAKRKKAKRPLRRNKALAKKQIGSENCEIEGRKPLDLFLCQKRVMLCCSSH